MACDQVIGHDALIIKVDFTVPEILHKALLGVRAMLAIDAYQRVWRGNIPARYSLPTPGSTYPMLV